MKINQSSSKPYILKSAALVLSMVALAALSACGKKDDGQTAGQKLDAAVASTEKAAAEAKAKAEASMAKAGDAMKDATQKAEASGAHRRRARTPVERASQPFCESLRRPSE